MQHYHKSLLQGKINNAVNQLQGISATTNRLWSIDLTVIYLSISFLFHQLLLTMMLQPVACNWIDPVCLTFILRWSLLCFFHVIWIQSIIIAFHFSLINLLCLNAILSCWILSLHYGSLHYFIHNLVRSATFKCPSDPVNLQFKYGTDADSVGALNVVHPWWKLCVHQNLFLLQFMIIIWWMCSTTAFIRSTDESSFSALIAHQMFGGRALLGLEKLIALPKHP